jgi:hypothetical protein
VLVLVRAIRPAWAHSRRRAPHLTPPCRAEKGQRLDGSVYGHFQRPGVSLGQLPGERSHDRGRQRAEPADMRVHANHAVSTAASGKDDANEQGPEQVSNHGIVRGCHLQPHACTASGLHQRAEIAIWVSHLNLNQKHTHTHTHQKNRKHTDPTPRVVFLSILSAYLLNISCRVFLPKRQRSPPPPWRLEPTRVAET